MTAPINTAAQDRYIQIRKTGTAARALLGQEMMRDPYWPFHAAGALDRLDRLEMPQAYDYVIRPGHGAELPAAWVSSDG